MTALWVTILAAQLATVEGSIGLAITGGSSDCVAMSGPPLVAGSVVTLANSGSAPQTIVTATIEEAVKSCAIEKHTVEGPYYRVRARAAVPEYLTVWVAFRGELASRTTPSGHLVIRLSAGYPEVRVRDCTSNEGVHHTVWVGEPLRSRRLWSGYFYLTYDVEFPCVEQDIHP